MLTRRSFLSITTAATAVAALGRVPQRHPLAIIALGPLADRVQRRLQERGYAARYWVWDVAPPDAADLGAAVPVVIPRRKWGERRGISDALAATLGDGRCTRVLLVAGLGDEVAARLAGPVARVLDERRTVVAVAALTPAREMGGGWGIRRACRALRELDATSASVVVGSGTGAWREARRYPDVEAGYRVACEVRLLGAADESARWLVADLA